MPVGTLATVKGLTPEQLQATGAQMILANTYHLHLQPGEAIIERIGGLHQFMGWSGPILTDSGGFQVFSLSELRQITETGVTFRSPKDGRIIELTPERSIQIQNALGADVIMAFDECPPAQAERSEIVAATERTYRWLERCIEAHQRPGEQALFGIVQGGSLPGFALCCCSIPGRFRPSWICDWRRERGRTAGTNSCYCSGECAPVTAREAPLFDGGWYLPRNGRGDRRRDRFV